MYTQQPSNRQNDLLKKLEKILIIIGLSIGIVFALHFILKQKDDKVEAATITLPPPQPEPINTTDILELLKLVKETSTTTNVHTITTTNVVNVTNYIIHEIKASVESNKNYYIQWQDSPVMQTWIKDDKTKVWQTALPYKDSMRSSPTLIFGLREDGVVVWKRITQ